MPEEPEVDNYWIRGNKKIPIFKLYKIAGTVVSKNDTKHTLSFCTREGMITVKFNRDLYAMFKKQISVQLPNGKKQVMEKSWFKRGNKLLLTGFRRDDTFVIKTYKSTGSHAIYIIDEINDKGEILIRHERFSASNQIEEDEGEQYD
jgi:DNA polymerase-3 subunit alpha